MAKAKTKDPLEVKQTRPALDPEARENQLIARAVDLAEQQLIDGTASSQVITHYLKLGSSKEKSRLELEKMQLENELTKAKTESIKAQERTEEKFAEAIEAMKRYSGAMSVLSEEDIDEEW